VACGLMTEGACDLPDLAEGLFYTQVAAGGIHTVLLRSDGNAVACGSNWHDRCNIPPLEEGLTYTQVSAGDQCTLLLRSDGKAVLCGLMHSDSSMNHFVLNDSYTQAAAGGAHIVLIRQNGTGIASGDNRAGQCNLPALDEGLTYGLPVLVLQASHHGTSIHFATLGGEEFCRIQAAAPEQAPTDVLPARLMREMGPMYYRFSRVHVVWLAQGENARQ